MNNPEYNCELVPLNKSQGQKQFRSNAFENGRWALLGFEGFRRTIKLDDKSSLMNLTQGQRKWTYLFAHDFPGLEDGVEQDRLGTVSPKKNERGKDLLSEVGLVYWLGS